MKPLRVIKVGGSLFDDPQLVQRARRWLDKDAGRRYLLIAGGGDLADSVRQMDQRFRIDDEDFCHWLCVDLLDATAGLFARICDLELTASWRTVNERLATGVPAALVFAPSRFLREQEAVLPGNPLPRSWEVTSDSIAARIAALLGAELVLWKSTSAPAGADLAELAEQGLVDAYFPEAAAALGRVRLINLRAD